eukprot:CAMPEP_0201614434 /NCGR_PEP_ID=MMETSP0492-20130828/28759_1 /ASSEMBLY_ACC=CAM_ASM_000837 /TAXON_ID=420259 /ORGANISM="Thalassiosira gravida, Strain GMp14c1" /LENGTH=111 /DNA_ID=CAMNT_0048081703 /DNA_START=105 /DNA_END=436 /DNA_ORIENTATION=+
MTSAAIPYQKIYDRRLARAIKRARSVRDRPTTALAREFFNDGRGGNADTDRPSRDRYNDDEWRTLPRRLLKLATYVQDPSSYSHGGDVVDNNTCDNNDVRRRLAAAVFAQA